MFSFTFKMLKRKLNVQMESNCDNRQELSIDDQNKLADIEKTATKTFYRYIGPV